MRCLIILLLLLSACTQTQEDSLKIGLIVPLTGPGASAGEEVMNGMLLAAEEIEEEIDLEIIVEDSRSNPAVGATAMNSLEARERPAVYVCVLSSVCMAMAPIAEESEVVLVGIVTNAPHFTAGRNWTFRYFPRSEEEVGGIISILEAVGAQSLGVLYLNDDRGVSVNAILVERFNGSVISERFERDSQDYRTQIAKLVGADAIHVVGFDPHLLAAFRQLKEAGYGGAIIAPSTASLPSVVASDAAEGIFLAAPLIYKEGAAQEFKQRYETRFGKPMSHYAANGYDFVMMLAGSGRLQNADRAEMRSILESGIGNGGVFGERITREGGHERSYPLYPARVSNGSLVYLE